MSKKVTVEDLGLKFDGMPEAQAAFLRKCAEMAQPRKRNHTSGLQAASRSSSTNAVSRHP